MKTGQGLVALSNATWRAVVEWILRNLGGKANLSEIYSAVDERAQEQINANPDWQAKVRQVLQKHASNAEWVVWRSEKLLDHHDHVDILPSFNLLNISFNQ